MIYLGINLLSKLKAQEMAGSLTGHYTSFLRQTNWTPFEPSWRTAVRYSLHMSTGRYLVCRQAMLQDFLVDKYKDFRPASDTWQCYILIAYNFQNVNRNIFPVVNVTNSGKITRFIRAKWEHAATKMECKDKPTHKCTSLFTENSASRNQPVNASHCLFRE